MNETVFQILRGRRLGPLYGRYHRGAYLQGEWCGMGMEAQWTRSDEHGGTDLFLVFWWVVLFCSRWWPTAVPFFHLVWVVVHVLNGDGQWMSFFTRSWQTKWSPKLLHLRSVDNDTKHWRHAWCALEQINVVSLHCMAALEINKSTGMYWLPLKWQFGSVLASTPRMSQNVCILFSTLKIWGVSMRFYI